MSTIWKNGKYQPLIKYATNKDFKLLSNLVNIINGDSNTKGSFRKTIKDLIGGAPEAYDTLKEIADKLKNNDDLHKALNDAIILKASSDALNKEITRAKQAEATIDEKLTNKADTTALNNYVLTTALNEQVDTLNAAISAKQDAGNYIPYDASVTDVYQTDKPLYIKRDDTNYVSINPSYMSLTNGDKLFTVNPTQLKHVANFYKFEVNSDGIKWLRSDDTQYTQINSDGISLPNGDNNHVLTSNASTIDITQYALKSELPTVPTKLSQLANDSEFITKSVYDEKIAALEARIAALEAKHTETNTQIET